MSHHLRSLLMSVAVLLGVTACSEATTVDLFNNTAAAITVTSCRGQQVIQPSTTGILYASVCWQEPTVSIQISQGSWVYRRLLDSSSPLYQASLRGHLIPMGIKYFAQLEQDGTAYFLPPSYRLPVTNPSSAPGSVAVPPIESGA